MTRIDINSDVGEGIDNEAQLLPFLSSCNIACGAHAGDVETMQRVVRIAQDHKVKIGAHPGYEDKANFGRVPLDISREQLKESIRAQILRLKEITDAQGTKLHHIKPHGALYNKAAIDQQTATIIIETIADIDATLVLYTPYNSVILELAQGVLPVKVEGFADRNYNSDYTLVSRSRNDALIRNSAVYPQKCQEVSNTSRMSFDQFTIQSYGVNALLIQWKDVPSRALFQHLTAAKETLKNCFQSEVILTYQELLIKNISTTTQSIKDVEVCLREIKQNSIVIPPQRRLRVPVCYELKFGIDLETLAKAKKISTQELIQLHTAPEYLIYFMGFLPGFPYLLGLDKQLHTDRKTMPSRQLPKGSVAIGGKQTGIYPQNSPGGWYAIGHCPIPIFDAQGEQGSLFRSGDLITFEQITEQEHHHLSKMSLKEYTNSSYLSLG